jgi:hypothetical protein
VDSDKTSATQMFQRWLTGSPMIKFIAPTVGNLPQKNFVMRNFVFAKLPTEIFHSLL